MRILDNNEVAQVSGGGLLGLNLNLLDLVGVSARVGLGGERGHGRRDRCDDGRGRRGHRHHNRGRHCW